MKGKGRYIRIITALLLIIAMLIPAGSVYATGRDGHGENGTDAKSNYTKTEKAGRDSEKNRKNDDNDKKDKDEKDSEDEHLTVDTSWFDYKDPKTEYSISTEAELRGLASLVNEEQPMWKPTRVEDFAGVTFTLEKDIKLTSEWTPIGIDEAVSFAGVFDGNGHTISGIDIYSRNTNTGLFGYLKGSVSDLTVRGKLESTSGDCGGIAGELDPEGSITNCVSDMRISAKSKTGGIVGNNNGGTVTGCTNLGKVSGTYKVGGIAGENWGGTIKRCGNHGDIASSVRGVATFGTGGVAGRSVSSAALVSECYNTGNIDSATESTGGVVGYMNASGATLEKSYNTGDIAINRPEGRGKISDAWAGGVAGTVGADGIYVDDCYSSGGVSGADTSGGVIGRIISDDPENEDLLKKYIRNNYYAGEYYDSGIGDNTGTGPVEMKDCTASVGMGAFSSITGSLGVAYMKDSSGLYGNGGYPVLRWQDPVSASEKTYIEGIPEDVQRKLDDHLINDTDTTKKGATVISVFDPENYLTDALVTYYEIMNDRDRQEK